MKKREISSHFSSEIIDSLTYDYQLAKKARSDDFEIIRNALIEKLKTIGFEFDSTNDFIFFAKKGYLGFFDKLGEYHFYLDYKDQDNLGIRLLSCVWETNIIEYGRRIECNLRIY